MDIERGPVGERARAPSFASLVKLFARFFRGQCCGAPVVREPGVESITYRAGLYGSLPSGADGALFVLAVGLPRCLCIRGLVAFFGLVVL